jgi:peptide/nickel transport system ATP-binding protein
MEPQSAEVSIEGTDVLRAWMEELRDMRRNIQMIFQDPYASLNPRITWARRSPSPS